MSVYDGFRFRMLGNFWGVSVCAFTGWGYKMTEKELTAIEMLTRYVIVDEEIHDITSYIEEVKLVGDDYIKLYLNDFPNIPLLGNVTFVRFMGGLTFRETTIIGVEVITK